MALVRGGGSVIVRCLNHNKSFGPPPFQFALRAKQSSSIAEQSRNFSSESAMVARICKSAQHVLIRLVHLRESDGERKREK